MMKKTTASLTTMLMMLFVQAGVVAQDEPPIWAPVEIYGCNFVGNADMDDLNGVIETWNQWMDDNDLGGYTAILLSPNFTAASFPYEVLWMGVWNDGAAMAGLQEWFTEGGGGARRVRPGDRLPPAPGHVLYLAEAAERSK